MIAGLTALAVFGSLPASAHVTVSSSTTVAGEYTLLTFSIPHGCAGSPTVEVQIELPEGIGPVTPSVNPNWEVERIRGADDNVTAVVYTAKEPLAADLRDAFEISALILPDASGDLVFPVVQRCEEGEEAWDEVSGEGENPHELEHPAPFLTVDKANGAEASEQGEGPSGLVWIALGLAAGAFVMSAISLQRREVAGRRVRS